MRKLLCSGLGAFLSTIVYAQVFSIVAGDTNGLSQHHYFNPPEHIERSGFGMENPIVYNLDVNLDGFDDITIKCGNSIGALGMASNYFTVKSIDSNDICYEYVDSSYCFNGYKPLYFAKMFNSRDTISFDMSYGQNQRYSCFLKVVPLMFLAATHKAYNNAHKPNHKSVIHI